MDKKMWDLVDYRTISKAGSRLHARALSLGIPNRFINRLRKDLTRYKLLWRMAYRPARELEAMRGGRGQEGGFEH